MQDPEAALEKIELGQKEEHFTRIGQDFKNFYRWSMMNISRRRNFEKN